MLIVYTRKHRALLTPIFGTYMRQFISLLFLVTFFGGVQNVNANEALSIKGRLLNEAQQPLSNISVTINNKSVTSDQQGRFVIPVEHKDIYQLNFVNKGYFQSIQTFSYFELFNKAGTVKQASIDDITLVEKAEKRVMLAFGGDVMMDRRYYKPYFW